MSHPGEKSGIHPAGVGDQSSPQGAQTLIQQSSFGGEIECHRHGDIIDAFAEWREVGPSAMFEKKTAEHRGRKMERGCPCVARRGNLEQLLLASQISECTDVSEGEVKAELIFVTNRTQSKTAILNAQTTAVPVIGQLRG